jgi:dihydroflavonol-4-reductase
MREIASVLRRELKEEAEKVPTRSLPDFVLRLLSVFDPTLRTVTPTLGRKHRHSSEKAQRVLGWRPRPGADTVVDCARSLLEHDLN